MVCLGGIGVCGIVTAKTGDVADVTWWRDVPGDVIPRLRWKLPMGFHFIPAVSWRIVIICLPTTCRALSIQNENVYSFIFLWGEMLVPERRRSPRTKQSVAPLSQNARIHCTPTIDRLSTLTFPSLMEFPLMQKNPGLKAAQNGWRTVAQMPSNSTKGSSGSSHCKKAGTPIRRISRDIRADWKQVSILLIRYHFRARDGWLSYTHDD